MKEMFSKIINYVEDAVDFNHIYDTITITGYAKADLTNSRKRNKRSYCSTIHITET